MCSFSFHVISFYPNQWPCCKGHELYNRISTFFARHSQSAITSSKRKVFIWAASWQNEQNDCAPSEGSIQPGHPPSLIRVFACAQWVAKDPSFLHADSEYSYQTGQMPRLIWVFAGRTCHFVVSWGGSFYKVIGSQLAVKISLPLMKSFICIT